MARRGLLTAAAAGVATASLLGGSYGARELLHRQAAAARRLIGKPLGEHAPDADRVWKSSHGNPLDLLLLGDSIAAGLGAERRKDTLGGRLSKGLAQHTGRAVRLRTAAVVGSESSELAAQLATLAPSYAPDLAVIVVGGNDVTHRVPVAESVAHLEAAIRDLRARGTEVVVGTCPDLGALRPVPQPLRSLGSRASRQLAAAQARGRRARRCARGVVGPGGRALLHHQPRRDVQPRPLPPQRAGLPTYGGRVAALPADRARAARPGALRARAAPRT